MFGLSQMQLIGSALGVLAVMGAVNRFADHYYDRGVEDATAKIEAATAKELAEVEVRNAELQGELRGIRASFQQDIQPIYSDLIRRSSDARCGYSPDIVELRNSLAARANVEIAHTARRASDALRGATDGD